MGLHRAAEEEIVSIPRWTMAQMSLLDMGNSIQLAGVIYADHEVCYICMLPEESTEGRVLRRLELDRRDWQQILEQTDKVQVWTNVPDEDGKLVKALARKVDRNISQNTSWAVYRRDGFKCRYCGADNVPMTVDHLVTWEEGGPSIEDNLVTSCRKCNKLRGNTEYGEWLRHPYYRKVSAGIDPATKINNVNLLNTLDAIPRRVQKRKGR